MVAKVGYPPVFGSRLAVTFTVTHQFAAYAQVSVAKRPGCHTYRRAGTQSTNSICDEGN